MDPQPIRRRLDSSTFSVSPSFEGIPGCQQIRSISSGAYGQVHHIRMTNIRPPHQPDAALKVFKQGDNAQINKLDCDTERAVMLEIASYEASTGQTLQISHLRQDIAGVTSPRLMLEYIPGSDLTRSQFRGYSMSQLVAFILSMMHQIRDNVLKGLHSVNIYHNDIKPANILFDPSKRMFYLIDFGLAVPLSLLHRSEFRYQSFWTTLPFMSPYHLQIMSRIRVREGTKIRYRLYNSSQIRRLAMNAEYYSLALTALTSIGKNCRANMQDPLCDMGRNVVDLQHKFPINAPVEFVTWDIQKIQKLLEPYWAEVEKSIRVYKKDHPQRDQEFVQLLTDWMLFPL